MCCVGVQNAPVAIGGVWGHALLGKFFKMDPLRCILAHSQPNITNVQ